MLAVHPMIHHALSDLNLTHANLLIVTQERDLAARMGARVPQNCLHSTQVLSCTFTRLGVIRYTWY